jgi:hypothetical protein
MRGPGDLLYNWFVALWAAQSLQQTLLKLSSGINKPACAAAEWQHAAAARPLRSTRLHART